jgi:(R,R)-butanediol dehydrogenase/meso-butanediol dehydrogenase/diacetyl reductase
MLAAYYEGDHRIVVHDVERQPPGRGEVQLQVAYSGICGTDLHIHDGDMDARVSRPAILGHEMSGTVVVVGDDVTDWASGDEVVVVPLDWCGTCPACLGGNSHICHRLNFIGIDSPGALQNFWNVPQRVLVPVPPWTRTARGCTGRTPRQWPCTTCAGPNSRRGTRALVGRRADRLGS